MKVKKFLITGGAGYIGSCFINYYKNKNSVFALDKKKLNKWTKIKRENFFKCDLLNKKKLEKIFKKIKPDLVVHLAAKSTVKEDISNKIYFSNNVIATKNLINVMNKFKVNKIIYSSTAAVYKKKGKLISEKDKLNPISKYGNTKLKAEELLKKNSNVKYIILRFFNVSSAISKPITGELHDPETHLIPIAISKTLNQKIININGNNYKTKDGTCIRDYIHVKDICRVLEKSIYYLKKNSNKSLILNIGNGRGLSNKDIMNKLGKIIKKKVLIKYAKRRVGDSPFLVCNIKKAKQFLNWTPLYSKIQNILKDEIIWSKFLIKNKIFRNI